ncbi:MAG: lamin tail domain-containing protein [Bacillota bacterium]
MKKLFLPFLFIFSLFILISCGEDEIIITLPDLTDKSRAEISTVLDENDINYNFEYETNTDLEEDTFIRYKGEYSSGDVYNKDETVTVVISTEDIVLPDLEGMTESQIVDIFIDMQATNFQFEIVTDNTVPDKTFVGYGDGLEVGDKVPSRFTFTVIIGYNSETMPDLTDMLKKEIELTLDEKNINYVFEYVEDDNYPEDSFAYYANYEVGDFYLEDTVTVYLYENTFTDAEYSLFISSYVDGGQDNTDRAIEIYNPTDSAIDLSDYHLVIYVNGSFEVTYQINFDEINLNPSEVYVIAHEDSNQDILDEADLITTDLLFDGNDTIQLRYKNGTYIDSIYHLGNRDFIMNDEVFVRQPNVTSGNRNYTFNEWAGFVPSYYEVLGSHPITIPTKLEFEFIDRDFYSELGGMEIMELSYINDGDTAAFYNNQYSFTGDERVRFLGIDTPETFTSPPEPWGLEAKDFTTIILEYADNNDKTIYIQSDPSLGAYQDTYGRHLGLIWVDLGEDVLSIDIKNSDDEVIDTAILTGTILLNYELVKYGFSNNFFGSDSELVYNNRYLYRWFQEAQRYAEENNFGIHE